MMATHGDLQTNESALMGCSGNFFTVRRIKFPKQTQNKKPGEKPVGRRGVGGKRYLRLGHKKANGYLDINEKNTGF